jgi:uncharacterized membrane protein
MKLREKIGLWMLLGPFFGILAVILVAVARAAIHSEGARVALIAVIYIILAGYLMRET